MTQFSAFLITLLTFLGQLILTISIMLLSPVVLVLLAISSLIIDFTDKYQRNYDKISNSLSQR